MKSAIPVYAVNLPHRKDRYQHIIEQYAGKPEFVLTVVPAIIHEKGAYGLWQTIIKIVTLEAEKDSSYFILCEDDHTFTEHYSPEILYDSIKQAEILGADILSGGYSWFVDAIQISKHLFWANTFTGMQFTIIFRKFYQSILNANFGENVVADLSLSGITENKFVIYPYISIQKEFGYSDVTLQNNKQGSVDKVFKHSIERMDILYKVRKYYYGKE